VMHAKKRRSQPEWAIDGDINGQYSDRKFLALLFPFDPKYVRPDYTKDRCQSYDRPRSLDC